MSRYKNTGILELIELAKNDDISAMNEIVRRYHEKVYNAFCALDPKEDLFDLTQDALLKISKSIKNLKNPLKFDAWMYQIIHNVFFDTLRRKRRKEKSFSDNPILVSSDDNSLEECAIDEKKTPDENYFSCELQKKLNAAIKELPALFRTIILLRDIEGLSYEEISKMTNLNIGTVKSRIARARIKLKKELEPYIK